MIRDIIINKLRNYSQEHLLRFEESLTEEEKQHLYKQIEGLNFNYLQELTKVKQAEKSVITPIKAMTVDEIEARKAEFEQIGLEALAKQEVGLLLLAGGMGTRLGSDKPKGMFNIGKTRDVYIFQRLIENTISVVEKCGKPIPFFIMTSEKNNEDTINFFEEHNYFGYDKNYVRFFIQEMAPCVSLDGKVLLEDKHVVATSPNGNGGWFNSLLNNAEAKKMLEDLNIKWLNIFAVDNVLQQIANPEFIGATLQGGHEIGAQVVRKADPYEKVGVMCLKNGKPSIVEYMDVTDEMAHETDENGERVYNFGVILNYLFNVQTLHEIKNKQLPIHIVTKKVEYIDENGTHIKPTEPNAHKFEMLCVDMIELANTCLPFEVIRERSFAPIKNPTGVDSVVSAQALLEQNGYKL